MLVVEGLVTTLNPGGEVNLSPMGPLVEGDFERLVLRPFRTSTTYANLSRTGQGVFHVTDDAALLAEAAIGAVDPPRAMIALSSIDGSRLADCCRWFAFRIQASDDSGPRAELEAAIVERGRVRDFLGFSRAKHAVVEAAILATRTGILPADEIAREMDRLAPLIQKTGGPSEAAAFKMLREFVGRQVGSPTDR